MALELGKDMTITWDNTKCELLVEDTTANQRLNGVQLAEELEPLALSGAVVGVTIDEVEDGKHSASIEFALALTAEEKTSVETLLASHAGKIVKARIHGSARFEVSVSSINWTRCDRRISFPRKCSEVPTVTLTNHAYRNASNLFVTGVSASYFDITFRVRVKNRNARAGLPSVSFDWEATL